MTEQFRVEAVRSGIALALRRNKYATLLALLLVSLTIQSFDAQPGAEGSLSDIFRMVLGVAICYVVFERPRERAGMAVTLGLALAAGWVRHFFAPSFDLPLSLALHTLMSLFLWVAVWAILRDLFRQPAAGGGNVLGAMCGYLIAGDAWAGMNVFTYLVMPTVYSFDPHVGALLADWHGGMALFSYYSISQMLTLGYSDVTPVRAPATTLALLTTMFGVFYTAIVVAQFVGMAQAAKRESPRGE